MKRMSNKASFTDSLEKSVVSTGNCVGCGAGKLIVTLKSGSAKTIPLAELKACARKSCASCRDFSSELADLSACGLGLEGSNCVIARTKEGQRIFKAAEKKRTLRTGPVGEDEPAVNLLIRLSKRKHSSKTAVRV